MILRAKILEIPAHLDWTEQNKYAGKRSSSLKALRGFFSGLMAGFIFRPYIFFIGIGSVLLFLSLYQLIWLLYDTLSGINATTSQLPGAGSPFSYSLSPAIPVKSAIFFSWGNYFSCSHSVFRSWVFILTK